MPFPDPGFSSGSGRRDVSAGKDFLWPMSDLTRFFLSVPAVFVIEIDVVLPGRLSLLLGRLHMFVPSAWLHHYIIMVMFRLGCRCLRWLALHK